MVHGQTLCADFVAKLGGLGAEFSVSIFEAACRSDKQTS
jgi:hypothetical protein